MGICNPHIDRRQFDEWSHQKMVDAYIGAKVEVMELKREVISLQAKVEHHRFLAEQ